MSFTLLRKKHKHFFHFGSAFSRRKRLSGATEILDKKTKMSEPVSAMGNKLSRRLKSAFLLPLSLFIILSLAFGNWHAFDLIQRCSVPPFAS